MRSIYTKYTQKALRLVPKQFVLPYILMLHLVYPIINIFELLFWRDYSGTTLLICLLTFIICFCGCIIYTKLYTKILEIVFSDTCATHTRLLTSGMRFIHKYPTFSAIFISSTFLLQLCALYFHDLPIAVVLLNCRLRFTVLRNLFLFPACGYFFLIYWNESNNPENIDQLDEYSFNTSPYSQNKTTVENTVLFSTYKNFHGYTKFRPCAHVARNYTSIAQIVTSSISFTTWANVTSKTACITTGGSALAAITAAGYDSDKLMESMVSAVNDRVATLPPTAQPEIKEAGRLIKDVMLENKYQYYCQSGSGYTLRGINRIFGADKITEPLKRGAELSKATGEVFLLAHKSPQEQSNQLVAIYQQYKLLVPVSSQKTPVVPLVIENSWFSSFFF